MTTHLADACCARLPPAALPHLAPLRARPGVSLLRGGDCLWLYWPAGDEGLAREVLALQGAELHLPRDGQWFRPGRHLPVVDVPRNVLERTDFEPFRRLATMPWAMTAHVVYREIDPKRPASLSTRVIQEVIRGSIGWAGAGLRLRPMPMRRPMMPGWHTGWHSGCPRPAPSWATCCGSKPMPLS